MWSNRISHRLYRSRVYYTLYLYITSSRPFETKQKRCFGCVRPWQFNNSKVHALALANFFFFHVIFLLHRFDGILWSCPSHVQYRLRLIRLRLMFGHVPCHVVYGSWPLLG